jgi:hypothetical protein
MAGLDPAIHVFLLWSTSKDVDARVKPGHDDLRYGRSFDGWCKARQDVPDGIEFA